MSGLFNGKQYWLLLAEGMRLSLTGSRGSQAGEEEDGSRHILAATYSLTLSTLVSGALFAATTNGQFLLANMTLAMVFFIIAVVGELGSGLFNSRDLAVTAHLPISGLTRFAARFSELCCTLLILTLNLSLVPAILLGIKTGNPLATPLYLVAAFAAAVFIASACLVLLTGMARFLGGLRLEGILLYLNIGLSLGIMGLLLNMSRLLFSGILAPVAEGNWPLWFPPSWFAGLPARILSLPSTDQGAYLGALIVLPAALLPLFLAAAASGKPIFSLGEARTRGSGRSAPSVGMTVFSGLFVQKHEQAAFDFTCINLARDRGFRLKAYPILGFPLLIMTSSLYRDRNPLFFIFMLYLMNLYLPLVISFLPFGDHHKGSWIFGALPIPGPRAFMGGVEKAFIYRIVLPLFLMNAITLGLVWSPTVGVCNAFFASLAGIFAVRGALAQMNAYPFAHEFRGSVPSKVQGALSVFMVVFGILAWVQYMALDNQWLFLAGLLVMAVFLVLPSLKPRRGV